MDTSTRTRSHTAQAAELATAPLPIRRLPALTTNATRKTTATRTMAGQLRTEPTAAYTVLRWMGMSFMARTTMRANCGIGTTSTCATAFSTLMEATTTPRPLSFRTQSAAGVLPATTADKLRLISYPAVPAMQQATTLSSFSFR